MKTLLLLLLSSCAPAYADSVVVSFGPSLDEAIGSQKSLQLGYELKRGSPFSLEASIGEWNEPGGFAFTGGVTVGVHIVSPEGLSMRAAFGPSVISQTDSRLSSLGEFHIQTKLGLALGNWQSGFQFDHWSNAGIVLPNLGRDIVSLYLGIPI